MKSELRILLCCLVLQVSPSLCLAHDNEFVHPAMSESAAQSSEGLKNFLSQGYGEADLNHPTDLEFDENRLLFGAQGSKSPLEWLEIGSKFEDKPLTRGMNHFYDPINKIGLTDGFDGWAHDSFEWATKHVYHISGEVSFPWLTARAFELNALTNSSKDVRKTSLGGMMCYLGHIIHLNQDLTVPAHVRNDNHGLAAERGPLEILDMWTEKFGKAHYANNPQWFTNQSHDGWSWWQNTAGFQKLEDFWNRGLLITNKAYALDVDARSSSRTPLGLAEFSNGNFISEDATYKECVNRAKHIFSYPSLDSTTYSEIRIKELDNVLVSSIHPVLLNNGNWVHKIFLRKERDGVVVSNHCTLGYLPVAAALHSPRAFQQLSTAPQVQRVAVTINDNAVLQDYHDILIPKTVEYSAGILDYFFRGTMDVKVIGYDTNLMQYTNLIVNTSGQDFGSGTYSAYYDDTNDVRTLIGQTNRLGTLPNGQSLKMTMLKPESFPKKFLLVYQGTVGVDGNGNAFDLVDSNICVAAKCFSITNEQIRTYVYWQPTNAVGTAITNTLESDDFEFTPTAGNYEVLINFASFDDWGTIGGVEPTDGPTSCTLLNEIYDTLVPAEQVTVVGNRLSVEVTAADDPICGEHIGWWTITITWRAWPAPE